MIERDSLLAEIGAEVETLVRKHRTAPNEITAIIAREAFVDAVSFAGIDAVHADTYFRLHFPTLSLYL